MDKLAELQKLLSDTAKENPNFGYELNFVEISGVNSKTVKLLKGGYVIHTAKLDSESGIDRVKNFILTYKRTQ